MDETARVCWCDAFQKELKVVDARRRQAGHAPLKEDENLVGLAFSGGGIRSATFGLGVLEGMKKHGLLHRIDYLSTVSGGGYIGAWLSANCQRAAKAEELSWLRRNADWSESVGHLRRYSNYLSPILGFFSADTWSIATIWLRNTTLVQLTVILAIAVLLLLPRVVFPGFECWPHVGEWRWTTIFLFILGAVGIAGNQLRVSRNGDVPLLKGKSWPYGLAGALVCLVAAVILGVWRKFEPFSDGDIDYVAAAPIAALLILAGFWLQPAGVQLLNKVWLGKRPPKEINYSQPWVEWLVVIPMMLVGFLVAAVLWGQSNSSVLAHMSTFGEFFTAAWQQWPFPLSVVFLSLWMFSLCSIRDWRDWKCLLAGLLAPVPAMLVLHALLSAIMLLLHPWAANGMRGEWLAYLFAPTLVLYAFSTSILILIGMLGRQSPEGEREWWSRFGAWLAIYGFAWLFVNVVTILGPLFSAYLLDRPWKGALPIIGGWVGTTLAGLFAGKSGSTNGITEKTSTAKALEWIAVIAPFVFIAGLLVAISTILHLTIAYNSDLIWNGAAELSSRHWYLLAFAKPSVTWAVLGVCLLCVLVLAARVDINEFSLNAFYRSRLVRCYLGAARFRKAERNPQKFTGFDDHDDLNLATLADSTRPLVGPLHIVNCALNLGGSSDLALHTRHSAIFTLTPIHCGSRYVSRDLNGNRELGYIPTDRYGGDDGQPTLGQAISVSGAAASPNMGYHTSPVVAFVMTLFNARLGWWFPNPLLRHTNMPSPAFSLWYLVKELFGGADDKTSFLAISDGGHFENLAAYELVRRQCRVIVISDAECDPELQFEGLATLIRMCDVDFGAKIHIDTGSIRPHGDSTWSTSRCAVGTIDYPGGDKGTLIYLKASMTGHEDTAVLQYKATHPTFPHESTGNQFYGEGQFESYRTLGRDIADKTLELVSDEKGVVAKADKLETVCSPSLHNVTQFTQHTTRLMEIWSELSGNSDFKKLDKEFAGSWPDHLGEDFRSIFYLCSEMIQLMENVYLDLGLEETWSHPDNHGWRTMFETWAKSPAIRKTWELTSGMYGLRFQHFCHRQFKLAATTI